MEHRQKLQTIFPYVLGVLTAEILAKRYRLEELRRQERRLSRELESLRESSDRWRGTAHRTREGPRIGPCPSDHLTSAASESSHSASTLGRQTGI